MERATALLIACALAGAFATRCAGADAAADDTRARPLEPPAFGSVNVAFLISPGSNVIDMTGPWEVFQDAHTGRRGGFRLYTVAATREPVRLTGGLHVIPDHSIADAPQPRVVVIPAMRATPEVIEWIRRVAPEADVVMSVCTGAFQLGRAGLLDGLQATTHHEFWDAFARDFPNVKLVRGERWVESSDKIATAGGLTSGIDLALRVVERYYGRDAARETAAYMEHRSVGLD